jgi:hypothetical protein
MTRLKNKVSQIEKRIQTERDRVENILLIATAAPDGSFHWNGRRYRSSTEFDLALKELKICGPVIILEERIASKD